MNNILKKFGNFLVIYLWFVYKLICNFFMSLTWKHLVYVIYLFTLMKLVKSPCNGFIHEILKDLGIFRWIPIFILSFLITKFGLKFLKYLIADLKMLDTSIIQTLEDIITEIPVIEIVKLDIDSSIVFIWGRYSPGSQPYDIVQTMPKPSAKLSHKSVGACWKHLNKKNQLSATKQRMDFLIGGFENKKNLSNKDIQLSHVFREYVRTNLEPEIEYHKRKVEELLTQLEHFDRAHWLGQNWVMNYMSSSFEKFF